MGLLFRATLLSMVVIVWQACEEETMNDAVECSENPVLLTLVSMEDATCNTGDGNIHVSADGGSGVYRFVLNDGPPMQGGSFENLAAGIYEIVALDENNCADTLELSVKNRDGVNMTLEVNDAGCGTSNGMVTINAADGLPPYEYRIGDSNFGGLNTFADLVAGEYSVQVRDATGCLVTQSLRIPSGISFENHIAPIIRDNCAVSGCHNGTQAPDLRTFKGVRDNAANVKKLTQDGTMPQTGSLTREQIDRIACWVDDGAPGN